MPPGWRSEGDGGKIEWESPELNNRAVSREQNELIAIRNGGG
jgi:hypothetical protein